MLRIYECEGQVPRIVMYNPKTKDRTKGWVSVLAYKYDFFPDIHAIRQLYLG